MGTITNVFEELGNSQSVNRLVPFITSPTPLDDPETILFHAKLISEKPFLRKLYADYYALFQARLKPISFRPGVCVELGSGGGFLKEIIPEVITTDVHLGPGIDRIVYADHLPFSPGEVKALLLLNVLHHLADPAAFLKEAERVLMPGGRVIMIEPFNSLWGRFFYKFLHHEPFNEKATQWQQQDMGRLSTSNQALAWIIFHRDRQLFEEKFPLLRLQDVKPHTVMCYLLSGGLSSDWSAPVASYPFFRWLDQRLEHFQTLFPVFQTVCLEKIA